MLRELNYPANAYQTVVMGEPAKSSGKSVVDVGMLNLSQSPDKQGLLMGRVARSWIIKHPLPITIEQDGDLFIVSDDIFSVYGDGDTKKEAFNNFIDSLIDYYHLLETRVEIDQQNEKLFTHVQQYLVHSP